MISAPVAGSMRPVRAWVDRPVEPHVGVVAVCECGLRGAQVGVVAAVDLDGQYGAGGVAESDEAPQLGLVLADPRLVRRDLVVGELADLTVRAGDEAALLGVRDLERRRRRSRSRSGSVGMGLHGEPGVPLACVGDDGGQADGELLVERTGCFDVELVFSVHAPSGREPAENVVGVLDEVLVDVERFGRGILRQVEVCRQSPRPGGTGGFSAGESAPQHQEIDDDVGA